jgi:hypothetical protein
LVLYVVLVELFPAKADDANAQATTTARSAIVPLIFWRLFLSALKTD